MNKKSYAAALLLSVLFTLSSVSGLFCAVNADGDADIEGVLSTTAVPEGYTEIYNFDQLMAINTNEETLGGKYILMNDIEFTEQNNEDFVQIGYVGNYIEAHIPTGEGIPIGPGKAMELPHNTPFTGIFDGNDHKIIGLKCDTSSSLGVNFATAGLFGYVVDAKICNLGVSENTVNAKGSDIEEAYAGGIAGFVVNSTIENCYSTGTVTVTARCSFAGGLVGYAWTSTIVGCYNSGSVTIMLSDVPYEYAQAGGIVGRGSYLTIENCHNTGAVTATSSDWARVGGMVGAASYLTTENCYNTGAITITAKTAEAGGIVALAQELIAKNCYNTGAVTVTAIEFAYAGGIAGDTTLVAENCYNTGAITATATAQYGNAGAGGIVGGNTTMRTAKVNLAIKNCYNDGNIVAQSKLADAGGIVGSASYDLIVDNCYNAGNVNSEGRTAGGIAGYAYSSIIDNCYNAGNIVSGIWAGGIVGSAHEATISNCYFLEGTVSDNKICGINVNSLILNDGSSTEDQSSGAKTASQMTPTLSNAQNNNSIYYVGSGGWDIGENGLWIISKDKNKGYPILQPLALSVGNTDSKNTLDVTTTVAIAAGAVIAIIAAGYFIFIRGKP
ncbi:MAG: hypothetical protein FWC29_03865 [Methanomassiliicoccaceae archaeon]|nr:hypothetical protein [Methanomassiliicoccaceae archaeon]